MELLQSLPLPSNPITIALEVVSVFALAAILERVFAWTRIRITMRNPQELLDLVRHGAAANELHESVARKGRWGPFGRIYCQWRKADGHRGHVEQAIANEEFLLERNLWILECAATIGPLLGILGTLVGIAQSFQGFDGIAELGPAVVSRGISMALTTTVIGLVVTVAAVITTHIFRRAANHAITEIEHFGEQLLSISER